MFANYSLGTEHIESVRLMRGKSGVHLDNKEQAIFEYCFSRDGKKVPLSEVTLLLLLDADHVEEAQTHRASAHARDTSPTSLDSEYIVCSFSLML